MLKTVITLYKEIQLNEIKLDFIFSAANTYDAKGEMKGVGNDDILIDMIKSLSLFFSQHHQT